MVGGPGVPLLLAVTGTNRHDVTQLEAVLKAIPAKRPTTQKRRSSTCVPMPATRARSGSRGA